MLPHVLKFGIATACLLASSVTYAATYSMTDEGYGGTFINDSVAGTNTYSLSGGDGGFPLLSSVVNIGGATGTGTFTRDAGGGNTFAGTLDFALDPSSITEDFIVFEEGVSYSGNLQITSGTGIFEGATGTGSFTGTDLYFALFATDPREVLRSTSRMAALILPPTGSTSQLVSWSVTTGDVNAVPIPAAAWLFGSGIMGLAGFRRKSKENAA